MINKQIEFSEAGVAFDVNFDDVLYLKGEKGDKGDPGEKGDKGDPGEKGEKGDTPPLDDYVKNTQFADKNGNPGVLRLKPGYGVSSGRYDGNSPITGDTIYIQKASEGQIKARDGQHYNPIVPSNLDYAVMCALAYPVRVWSDSEKQKALQLLLPIAELSPLFGNDTIIADGRSLASGKTYKVSYYVGGNVYEATATAKSSNVTSHGTVRNIQVSLNGVTKYVYSSGDRTWFDENGSYDADTVRFVSVKEV